MRQASEHRAGVEARAAPASARHPPPPHARPLAAVARRRSAASIGSLLTIASLTGRRRVRVFAPPRQGPCWLPAAYARSDRLTPGTENPPIEPAIHSEHNRQDRNPDHALPHPYQGAVSRNRNYTVPTPPRPATPTRVRVLRTETGLTVSWLPADRWGCLVVATLSDGRRVLYRMPPMRHSLRISRLAPGIGARITVSDLGQTGNTGVAADASLAPSRPGPVTGVTANRAGRRLTISWRRAIGASRYIVTVTVRGRTPVTLIGLTTASRVTVIKAAHYLLASGAIAQITVRGVNSAGEPGLAGTVRYTPRTSGRNIPQSPPDRPLLGALDAID